MYENPLPPLTAYAIVNYSGGLLTVQAQARKAKFSDAIVPAANNAWCYVMTSPPSPQQLPAPAVLNTYLGPIINVKRGTPCQVKWVNTLKAMPSMVDMQEDPPINPVPMSVIDALWPMPAGITMNHSLGIVTHLHGGKVHSGDALHNNDGWPLTPVGYASNPYGFATTQTYTYPNDQRAAMLWFHDHGMDCTATQVHAGLAGLYFVRDGSDDEIFAAIETANQLRQTKPLPTPKHFPLPDLVKRIPQEKELPLVIQDRMVACGNDGVDYWAGIPTVPADAAAGTAGYARPEFLGDTIFVNGRAAPFHNVDRLVYRLRILNGSNARTYALALMDPAAWTRSNPSNSHPRVWYSDCMRVIGNEAGLINQSRQVDRDGPSGYLLLAPGERLDVLLNLQGVPNNVDCLRLVNLAVASARNNPVLPNPIPAGFTQADLTPTDTGPEGIFQTDALSVLTPVANGANDLDWANILKLGPANIMQFCLPVQQRVITLHKGFDVNAVDAILAKYTNETNTNGTPSKEGFVLDSAKHLGPNPANVLGAAPAHNRLVLLMNNNAGVQSGNPASSDGAWQDTQIWELGPNNGSVPVWPLPFTVDTATATVNPAAGAPSANVDYGIYRATFFQPNTPGNPYPPVHAPTFTPKSGTYERWYVANLGNDTAADVDMHPFHMHLVNFVVTRRWKLNAAGAFDEMIGTVALPGVIPERPLDFDRTSRHDTVRVQSNELVELLVYFPPGYTGSYPYHCHLVEHEDMGMMLHFDVV